MRRQLEPELMDDAGEAAAYDAMDHAEVNRRFVDDLLGALGTVGILDAAAKVSVVDLGTGTARIPIELCRRDARFAVTAVDAAQSMLEVAERNVGLAGLADRIALRLADAKLPAAGAYDVVMSNSLAHHLPEPAVLFDRAVELAAAGGLLFIRDLFRPADEGVWQHLVATYAGQATADQRKMFADSLKAALTVDEVRELVVQRGFDAASVQATTDRHWAWVARRVG